MATSPVSATRPTTRMLPITAAPPHEGVIPHFYTILLYTETCLCCRNVQQHSELYTETHLRSLEKPYKPGPSNLRRIFPDRDTPKYDLPLKVLRKKPTTIPFCHICANSVSLKHLPKPPAPTPVPTADLLRRDVIRAAPSGPQDGVNLRGSIVRAEAIEGTTTSPKSATRAAGAARAPKVKTVDDLASLFSSED